MGGGKINKIKKSSLKLLAQLLCISTIIGTASCNDDQVFNQTDTTPLQVSVNAQGTQSSRTIIHGEYLPDQSSIGISLFTPDGADYDNQGYFNVKYTASGEGAEQTWSAQSTTPSISANPANLLAYYPWSDDADLDLTAIPVENASQTDYMWAAINNGITNANPKVNIIMKHALTAIRVNLVLGNYTGDAAVSGIAVKSPALASSATLDICDGSLDNISGQDDEFALTTEFELSAAGTATDVLFVPDVSVTEGSTTVSAIIGGKKYTAAIGFDEAYLQGYIYTYTLTLNNSGFQLTKVNVTPWKDGTDKEAELEVYKDIEVDKTEHSTSKLGEQIKFTITAKNSWTASADQSWCTLNVTSGEPGVTTVLATVDENMLEQARFATITVTTENYSLPVVIYQKSELDDEYIVKVLINNDNMPYQHNIKGFVGTIDWGDGTIDTYTTESTWPEHIYAKAGTYTVMAKGTANAISMIEGDIISGNVIAAVETPYIKELVSIGSDMGITSMNCAFATHTMLDNIYPDAISGLKAQNFTMIFGMTGLKTVPQGLFDNCTEATNFYGAFGECNNLQSIPEGLFYNCKEVTNFGVAFAMTGITEIPSYTFGTEAAEVDFTDIFLNTNIFAIKSNAFNCPNITSLAGLFKENPYLTTVEDNAFNCPGVTSFEMTFGGCTNLTNISASMFDNCTGVTDFSYTFAGTGIIEIPNGLFDKCTEVTSFNGTFAQTKITVIPAGLFDSCTKVTNFNQTFYWCENLTDVPSGLFDNCTEVTNFGALFTYCAKLQTIPEGLFGNCTKVESFGATFNGCKSLTELPSNTFNSVVSEINFINTLKDCQSLAVIKKNAFNCPNLLSMEDLFQNLDALTTVEEDAFYFPKVTDGSGMFYGCNSLQTLPEGLFDECTEVTDFSYAFQACALQTIPEGLFGNCTKVSNFSCAFRGCSSLTAISSNTFATEVADVNFELIFDGCKSLAVIKKNAFNCPNITSMFEFFKDMTSLTTIEDNAFNCPSVTNFHGTFDGCTGLKNISANMFDNCTGVTDLNYTFADTGIIEIPNGLFDNCTEVTEFEGTFAGCSNLTTIPEGLFDNCTEVTDFDWTFKKCTSLQAIPERLFDNNRKVTNFYDTFRGCESLTSIPEGLFDNNTEVTSFTGAFAVCESLQAIPEGLFDSCTKVTDFEGTFYYCKSLTEIPNGLFDKCTEVTSFYDTFSTTSITTIPEGLFDKCTEVSSFSGTFQLCINLTKIPEGLFEGCTKVTSFARAFQGCENLTTVPAGLFDACTEVTSFGTTFANCTNLTAIPEGLFDYNTKVDNFQGTFRKCSNLTGESPYTVINIDGVETKVHLYERISYPEYFTNPTYFISCFNECINFIDYNSFPSKWKSNL